jgi:hypothetical protein
MNLEINIEALQSYQVEDHTIQFLAALVHDALNQSELFSVTFEITRLKFGSRAPTLNLLSMKDVDVGVQWKLRTHEILIPGLPPFPFTAPFQAVLEIHCESDFQMIFNATLSYNQIAIGAIKYPLNASISDIIFHGRLSVQFLGDALVLFFESTPDYRFNLAVQLGAEEKLIDEHHIRGLLMEMMNKWLTVNMIDGNAVRIPLKVDH